MATTGLYPGWETFSQTEDAACLGSSRLRNCRVLLSLQREWDQLLSQFPQATTFSTLDWLVPWWRAFGKGQLKVIAFFEARSLVALAPLAVVPHSVSGGMKLNLLRLMGDGSGDSDNLDLAVRPGYEAVFIDRLLGLLARCDFRWDFCRLNTLPENSPAAAVLGLARAAAVALFHLAASTVGHASPRELGRIPGATHQRESK